MCWSFLALLSEHLKLSVYKSLDPESFTIKCLLDEKNNLPPLKDLLGDQSKDNSSTNHSASIENFSNLWLKFLIRFLVVKKLMKVPEIFENVELVNEFQNVVGLISNSAEVAEYCLQKLTLRSASEMVKKR